MNDNKTHHAGRLRSLLVAASGMVLLLVAVCVAVIIARRPHPVSSDHTVVLRVAYRPRALADVTPVVIREFHLSSPDVEVQLIPVPDPTTAMQRFQAGEVDALAGIPLETILNDLVASGQLGHRKFIAYSHQMDVSGEGWVSLVGNQKMGIASIGDLAKKPVASLPTSQAQWLLRRILIAAGIPTDQIKITQYNPATPTAGLAAGTQAGTFGLEPMISKAVAEGNVILERGPISHFLYNDKPVIVSASLISSEFVAAHPAAFASFLSLIDQAVRLTKDDPNRVRLLFTKRDYGELDPDVASKLFMPVMSRPDIVNRDTAQRFVNDAIKDGILPGAVDLSPLFPPLPPSK